MNKRKLIAITIQIKREVLKFWAELLRAPKDKWWGYVTNGGTEGNLYGLWLARECCPKGIVYYSEDTHYSIDKNLHFLKMPQARIPSQKNGEIDYKKLQKILTKNRKKPLVSANCRFKFQVQQYF